MRFSIMLRMAPLIAFTSGGISAQHGGINRLRGQILEQEMAVERAPGKNDGKAWLKLAVLRQNAAQYRDSERAYRRAASVRFEKGVGAKYLELKITDHERAQQPEFEIKDWE